MADPAAFATPSPDSRAAGPGTAAQRPGAAGWGAAGLGTSGQEDACPTDLARRLAGVKARFPACDVAAVTEVVRAVLASMTGHLTGTEMSLLAEVQELGKLLARARAEIAAMRVEDITASHIPAASDELEAILTHTAAATHCILEVCESLDGLADSLERPARGGPSRGAAAVALRQATMRVYEACGFQDLTGQRIAKVVLALQVIDARIARILQSPHVTGGPEVEAVVRATLANADPGAAGAGGGVGEGEGEGIGEGEHAGVFLHGPQAPGEAMDQSDIDLLLAGL